MHTPVIFGSHEPATIEQFTDVSSRAERAVLCADGHFGYVMPVGGVCAYRNRASVIGVGYDIACGNAAILTDRRADAWDRRDLGTLANAINNTISFGLGRTNREDDAPVDDPLFDDPAWDALPVGADERESLRERARAQLGTVGSGNHYVDVFRDEQGRVWVGVHFGSRGLGHQIASGFLALGAGAKWGERVPESEVLLDLASPLGDAYWTAMELAGHYAYAGREWVARKVVELMGGMELDIVHNHHNFAWRETHGGEELVVIRKGSTPAFPGQRGFVGGSMGDDAVIIEGVDSDVSQSALYSTVHGAGRVMGRQEAKRGRVIRDEAGRVTGRDASVIVTREMQNAWLAERGVVLRGSDVDESPHVYRRLPDVLAAHEGTIRVVHTLSPMIVVMAGREVRDPYKD